MEVDFLVADPDEAEKITPEGMVKFLEDLQLNPESRVVLILAWKFKAATQCEFTREEFVDGMTQLGFVCTLTVSIIKVHCCVLCML